MPAVVGPMGCGYGKMMPLPISHFKTRTSRGHLISRFQVVSGVNNERATEGVQSGAQKRITTGFSKESAVMNVPVFRFSHRLAQLGI
jgi:hypothetical protein